MKKLVLVLVLAGCAREGNIESIWPVFDDVVAGHSSVEAQDLPWLVVAPKPKDPPRDFVDAGNRDLAVTILDGDAECTPPRADDFWVQREAERVELWRALNTRLLSNTEYARALEFGDGLNIAWHWNCTHAMSETFIREHKSRELSDAFERQNQILARETLKARQ